MMCSFQPSDNISKVEKKDIGIQLYSVRGDIQGDFSGFPATIKAVGELGYTTIEAANYGGGKFYGMTPEEFKKAIEDAGMSVLSSHTGKSLESTDPEKIKWDDVWAWWDQCIAAHKAAGMKYIVTPSMPTPETLEGLKVYCDYYNRIGEKCLAQGMKFGYHNHAYELEKKYDLKVEGEEKPQKISMYDYMLKNTNPNFVFFQMDVYWVVRGGESPVDYFGKYPGRFEVLHIKDNKELGQSGMVGFDAIFNNIDKSGVKYLVVEVEKYNFTPIESIKRSLDYLLVCPLVKKSYADAK
ncbi:MAG: sugar phosphate isomerase/epimerase [Dysgonamonadaceae bacterium]|nr:sugar phosphate isomerase/epimerase [Dysgonamonadaceae bacterium]